MQIGRGQTGTLAAALHHRFQLAAGDVAASRLLRPHHALDSRQARLDLAQRQQLLLLQRMLGHASAAMTLDVYADLFDSDLTSVAESVAKMWPREA